MDSQSILFEKRAQAAVNKLKETYVIDFNTAEQLRDIFIYLYLSQLSRNPRGINIQTEKLKNVLHNCPKVADQSFPAQMRQAARAA